MTEAEMGVIGSILIDNDSLSQIYSNLRPDMFGSEFCQDAYKQILALYDRGENINLVSLSQAMENHKWSSEQVSAELKECVLLTPTSVSIKSYAITISKDYKTRTAKELFQRVSLMPCDIENTIAEVLITLEKLQENETLKAKSLKQIVQECKENYFNEHVGEKLLKTGFYKLDDCLGGLEGGDVTVIGARPSVGKSAFVTQVIGQMAKKGYKIGYFNLEMNESQVYERFVSRLSEISLTRVRRAKSFLGGEKESFDKANEEMSNYNVLISTGSKTVGELKVESRHQQFDVIIIDYLQLIKADRKFANRASEVGDISKAVKALAMELHVPIILLSQLNRTSEIRDTKEPTMSELRESGDIEQDASNIILLWNVSEDKKYKGLKVEKQRQGENMKEGLKFDGEHMRFEERMEDFDKFLLHVKNSERNKQEFMDAADTPFDSWGG